MNVFNRDLCWFKIRHPFLMRRVRRESALQGRIYDAIAGTLKAHKIPDEVGPRYEDEPSYDIMHAVMVVLRREGVKL